MGSFFNWVEVEYGILVVWLCVTILFSLATVVLVVALAATGGNILWFSSLIPLYLYVRYRWSKWRNK